MGPLTGVRVIDLTRALSGPYATLLLAGLGAEIIKVEDPDGGDVARGNIPYLGRDGISAIPVHANDVSVPFLDRCRGKQGVTLNLKHPEAIAVFDDLVGRAEIVVENFSAGVADRLGVGYEHARSVNPGIVYTSISGFGSGTVGQDSKAYDLVIQALSGLSMVSGEASGGPVRLGLPIGDLAAPLFAVMGTLAALVRARETGAGQHVDVSMLGALTSLVAVEPWQAYDAVGMPSRTGNYLNRLAPFGIFEALDGQVAICAANDRFFAHLPAALDRPELLEDERYAKRAHRAANADGIHAIIAGWARQRSVAEITKRMTEAGIPVAPVRTPQEAVADPRVTGRGETVPLEHPDYGAAGDLLGSGTPWKFSETEAGFDRPAPLLGQDNADVYGSLLGYPPEKVAAMAASGLI
jgi:CoA:oxalate CoA-transferase